MITKILTSNDEGFSYGSTWRESYIAFKCLYYDKQRFKIQETEFPLEM